MGSDILEGVSESTIEYIFNIQGYYLLVLLARPQGQLYLSIINPLFHAHYIVFIVFITVSGLDQTWSRLEAGRFVSWRRVSSQLAFPNTLYNMYNHLCLSSC